MLELVGPVRIPSMSRDPKGDKLLATGRAARAWCLVSQDTDLADLNECEGILIDAGCPFVENLENEVSR
jgi:predicted nucleic acid-binding protein